MVNRNKSNPIAIPAAIAPPKAPYMSMRLIEAMPNPEINGRKPAARKMMVPITADICHFSIFPSLFKPLFWDCNYLYFFNNDAA
jgi:hypothetical protein